MATTEIVVLGPMTPERGKADTHTIALRRAIETVIARHGLTDCTVIAPDDMAGSGIPADVFGAIDRAEVIVADISRRRPDVLYEIALGDALGLPTVLVAKKGTKLPFYFTQQRVRFIDAFDEDTIAAALEKIVIDVAKGNTKHLVANPISEFYGAPVVDISAAAGLAIGYFRNFLDPIIRADPPGVIAFNPNHAKGVVVVCPDPASNVRQDWGAVHDALAAATGGRAQDADLLRQGFEPDDPAPRPFKVKLLGRMIVDLLTPVYSLSGSPRVKRLADGDGRTRVLAAMTTKLVATLESELHRQNVLRDVVELVPMTGLAAALERRRDWWQ